MCSIAGLHLTFVQWGQNSLIAVWTNAPRASEEHYKMYRVTIF